MSIQINFKKVENISFDEQIHSYTELMEEMRTKNVYNQCEQKQNEPNILHARIKEKTMQEITQDVSQENIPLIKRVIDRDKAKNFTEYALSRPVTFAHKCEELMIGCSAAAMLCGLATIASFSCPEYIPTNEKATLSCVALTGLCMIGSVLSGVVGGVSECIVERKNHLMQERMGHTRD